MGVGPVHPLTRRVPRDRQCKSRPPLSSRLGDTNSPRAGGRRREHRVWPQRVEQGARERRAVRGATRPGTEGRRPGRSLGATCAPLIASENRARSHLARPLGVVFKNQPGAHRARNEKNRIGYSACGPPRRPRLWRWLRGSPVLWRALSLEVSAQVVGPTCIFNRQDPTLALRESRREPRLTAGEGRPTPPPVSRALVGGGRVGWGLAQCHSLPRCPLLWLDCFS